MSAPSEGDQAELVRSLSTARERTAAQVDALARDLDQIFEASELVSTDDEHAQAREDLGALDRALAGLQRTGRVRCEGCGEPIAFERLLALPTARTCIRCAPR